MIDHYDWEGGREAMLRFGPATGPVIVAALPLFEEANRTRTFLVTILRALAERGIASALPDIPGQGESLVPTESLSFLRMQEGFEYAAAKILDEGRKVFAAGIRSGCLLDAYALASGRWHFAPCDGSDLVRELKRIKEASTGQKQGEYWYFSEGAPVDVEPPVEVAGNLILPDLITDIALKTPFDEPGIPRRVVRHETDARAADLKVPGAPLWRRAEPDNDPVLAELLAEDIAAWVRACEG